MELVAPIAIVGIILCILWGYLEAKHQRKKEIRELIKTLERLAEEEEVEVKKIKKEDLYGKDK